MANIQQSLNSMLASAQTGAFITQQTPAYKQNAAKKAELLALDKEQKAVTNLMSAAEDTNTAEYEDLYEQYREIDLKRAKIEPTKENLRKAEIVYYEKAEEGSDFNAIVKPLVKKQNTLRSQLESLIERRDILSAKERGQLDTMYHKHLKKGELD